MILVINSGSSSIKFKLFNQHEQEVQPLAEGLAERIMIDGALQIKFANQKYTYTDALPNHEVAMKLILDKLISLKVFSNLDEITGVGFRTVHGGNISKSSIIDDAIYAKIVENTKLAPLHNPGALIAIDAIKKLLPRTTLVACFDTAFHQTMPEVNYLYAVPYSWYTNYDVRKYGFHGLSYQYILKKMSAVLQKEEAKLNLIVCHLGNGASVCCIKDGKSLDTTMGMTPLAGLMMGTRSGDIDPGIIQYMTSQLSLSVEEITDLLNKESGLKGMSLLSADMREITDAYRLHNVQAMKALEKYTQIVSDFVIKYANYLDGEIDSIVFTGGIGENSVSVKDMIVKKTKLLKLKLNQQQNEANYDDYLLISDATSTYPVYKVRTDEETMICFDTLELL